MITCPFCNQKVKDKTDQSGVEDNHANNFYCPTMVKRFDDLEVSHYARQQMTYLIQGQKVYQYTATIPPFQVVWYTTGKLWVYQYDSQTREPHELYHKKSSQFKTFLDTCRRFKVLVPFS